MSVTYRAFPQFNRTSVDDLVSSTSKLSPQSAQTAFGSDRFPDRCVRELAAERALPIKEIVETFEMFERVREQVRGEVIVDLCAGHGLLGILYAAFERSVELVLLLDRSTPANHARVMKAIVKAAPWVGEKVRRIDADVQAWSGPLDEHIRNRRAAFVSAHACGVLTDSCLEVALARSSPVAVMPCCYPWRACPGPPSIKRALGVEFALDIDRTYRMEQRGFSVLWREIPEAITPKNRILIGKPSPGTGQIETTAGEARRAG
jgi:hypothetical protein